MHHICHPGKLEQIKLFVQCEIDIKVTINKDFKTHPIYNLYAADKDGKNINIFKQVPLKGKKTLSGYKQCKIRRYGCEQKIYYFHRFVWECFNDLIPGGMMIDYINDNKEDNRLCNLQLIQQTKKSISNRDYTFVGDNLKNRKCVKAINMHNKEVLYFYSMHSVQQHLQINAGIVKMICEGKYNSSISKKDGNPYNFEYIKEYLPDNYHFIKSSNIKPKRVSDEDKKKHRNESVKKWQNKEYVCPKCGKTFKNYYKSQHNKICKGTTTIKKCLLCGKTYKFNHDKICKIDSNTIN